MKRPSSVIYAVLVAGIFVWLALAEDRSRKESATARLAAERDAEFTKAREATAAPPPADEAKLDPETSAATAPSLTAQPGAAGKFMTMADGSAVPALPASAPNKMKVGIALFRYKGAEAPPASERSRSEALSLAKRATEVAREDFEKAVKMADPGSDANLGWMSRGVLEPTVEYAVFSLEKGQVGAEPIDTPRGFWVVKRLR